MKDKRLTDIEEKIQKDFNAGNFNLGDPSDLSSVLGMALDILKGAPETPAGPTEGTWKKYGRLGGVGHIKCDCGCWEGKTCISKEGKN